MKATLENPIYTAYLVSGTNKYNLTDVLTGIDLDEQEQQLAQCATVSIINAKTNGQWISSIIGVRNRIYIYANDGEQNREVFRGFVWTKSYKTGLTDREITLKCYDNLIYFQESEDAEYFTDGKSSEDIIATFCDKWGVELSYSYDSITHSKLALRGNLADIITADVLDLVKDRTGNKYIIRSDQDIVHVMPTGQNSTVYSFVGGKNIVTTKSEETMEGMITRVVILGRDDDKQERLPVEATLDGDTDGYGTLQKIISRNENTELDEAKREAEGILKESGDPKREYEVTAPDVPWIRKGDRVFINAGDIINSYMIVSSISHSINNKSKEMSLTLRKP